jgi:hypothetical protein
VAAKAQAKENAGNPRLMILIAVLIALVGGAIWWIFLRGGTGQQELPGLTPEAKAYTKNLALADVEMKANDSFMQSTLVEVTGKITNNGDRNLKRVEINCVFYDPYGQVLSRERVAIVRPKEGVLEPGKTRQFRLPFDAIPQGWNQTMPQMVIAHVEFAN